VRDLIRSLRERGMTVFLNSHLLSEVEMVCDRVAIIDRGRVVHTGRLDDLVRVHHSLEDAFMNLVEAGQP
jgi:ABC-2 type transport system ATP-binding protein